MGEIEVNGYPVGFDGALTGVEFACSNIEDSKAVNRHRMSSDQLSFLLPFPGIHLELGIRPDGGSEPWYLSREFHSIHCITSEEKHRKNCETALINV